VPAQPRTLARLQQVTPDEKRNIARFLTATEAVYLMLASKDLHRAIKSDPWLRLYELSTAFATLGCSQLVTDICLLDKRLRPLDSAVGGPPTSSSALPHGSTADIAPTVQRFNLVRSIVTKAFQAAKPARVAVHDASSSEAAEKAELSTRLMALEPAIENVVFRFASERLPRPQHVDASDSTEQPIVPAEDKGHWLHNAITDGVVEIVQPGLREFLSLPERLISQDRKVARLGQSKGKCTLKSFGQHRCGTFKPLEIRQYEAILAYVDAIVSSQYLRPSDKERLCVQGGMVDRDPRSKLDVVRHAMACKNPAVAAMILLGIQESSASRKRKQSLLHSIGSSWDGGIDNCVQEVINALRECEHRAPEWVNGIVARLALVAPSRSGDFS
jgi:hypothetical protein